MYSYQGACCLMNLKGFDNNLMSNPFLHWIKLPDLLELEARIGTPAGWFTSDEHKEEEDRMKDSTNELMSIGF